MNNKIKVWTFKLTVQETKTSAKIRIQFYVPRKWKWRHKGRIYKTIENACTGLGYQNLVDIQSWENRIQPPAVDINGKSVILNEDEISNYIQYWKKYLSEIGITITQNIKDDGKIRSIPVN
jgi:hypothetical protein